MNRVTRYEAFKQVGSCPSCGRPVLPDLPSVCLFDIDVLNGERNDSKRLEALRARGLIKVRPTALGRQVLQRHKDDEQWLRQHRAVEGHPQSASWGIDNGGITGPIHCMAGCSSTAAIGGRL